MMKKDLMKKKKPQKKKKAHIQIEGQYFQGLGRRKTAIAKVKMIPSKSEFKVSESIKINGHSLSDYFPLSDFQGIIASPFETVGFKDNFEVSAFAKGGGLRGQAEALRLAVSRALVNYNRDYKKSLRNLGYLTRDARKVERKKAGLKKARRAPQWQKR